MSVIRAVPEAVLQMLAETYELVNSGNLLSVEQGLHRMVSEAACTLLTAVLAERDEELAAGRDKTGLRQVGKRTRSVLTPVGELRYTRRYYRDVKTGRGRYLLDEELGLSSRQRLSPWLEQLLVRTAVDMPYHRATRLLSEVLPAA